MTPLTPDDTTGPPGFSSPLPAIPWGYGPQVPLLYSLPEICRFYVSRTSRAMLPDGLTPDETCLAVDGITSGTSERTAGLHISAYRRRDIDYAVPGPKKILITGVRGAPATPHLGLQFYLSCRTIPPPVEVGQVLLYSQRISSVGDREWRYWTLREDWARLDG